MGVINYGEWLVNCIVSIANNKKIVLNVNHEKIGFCDEFIVMLRQTPLKHSNANVSFQHLSKILDV